MPWIFRGIGKTIYHFLEFGLVLYFLIIIMLSLHKSPDEQPPKIIRDRAERSMTKISSRMVVSQEEIRKSIESLPKRNYGYQMAREANLRFLKPVEPPPPLPSDEEMEAVQEQRRSLLREGCKKIKLSAAPAYHSLLVPKKSTLSYCPISKTGWNWVASRLLDLKREKYPKHELIPIRKAMREFMFILPQEKYLDHLSRTTNFVVVRHPFDRLIASYHSLLENNEKKDTTLKIYSKLMTTVYRKNKENATVWPTFEEFVDFLTDHSSLAGLPESWQPMANKCTPCQIAFNVIGHYETLWQDASWAWKKAGLPFLKTDDYLRKDLTRTVRPKYIKQLTKDKLLRLYTKFEVDFLLFGYNISDILPLTKDYDDNPEIIQNITNDLSQNDLIKLSNEIEDNTTSTYRPYTKVEQINDNDLETVEEPVTNLEEHQPFQYNNMINGPDYYGNDNKTDYNYTDEYNAYDDDYEYEEGNDKLYEYNETDYNYYDEPLRSKLEMLSHIINEDIENKTEVLQ